MSSTISTSQTAEELVQIHVPRKFYIPTLNFLARLIADYKQPGTDTITPPIATTVAPTSQENEYQGYNGWTAEEIARLRSQLPPESAAITLFDLACQNPGKRVTFDDLLKASGKDHNRARADLAVLTKKIRGIFGRDRHWPLMWVQEGSNIIYFASPGIAKAWHAAAER